MPSERAPLLSPALSRGDYAPAGPNDKRGPCPLINCLANHGYISRDGQNIPARELNAAMEEVGLSKLVGTIFAQPIYNVHGDSRPGRLGFLARFWFFLRNPWMMLGIFGMRKRGQEKDGQPVLNIDQLSLHNVVEHDVSLTRRDYLQKEGNCTPQPDLVHDLLACSKDGGKTITIDDLAELRKRRLQKQLEDNPGLEYGAQQHAVACGEVALILACFGDGKSVRCDYMKAFFEEERLPSKEGWKKRWWWTLGLVELQRTVQKVRASIGLDI
ncbi:hypothetical protein ACEQ8H_003363 [Pleosporales sp. CAS-2024a]